MATLTERAAAALRSPGAMLLPAPARELILDLVRELDALRTRVDHLERDQKAQQ